MTLLACIELTVSMAITYWSLTIFQALFYRHFAYNLSFNFSDKLLERVFHYYLVTVVGTQAPEDLNSLPTVNTTRKLHILASYPSSLTKTLFVTHYIVIFWEVGLSISSTHRFPPYLKLLMTIYRTTQIVANYNLRMLTCRVQIQVCSLLAWSLFDSLF